MLSPRMKPPSINLLASCRARAARSCCADRRAPRPAAAAARGCRGAGTPEAVPTTANAGAYVRTRHARQAEAARARLARRWCARRAHPLFADTTVALGRRISASRPMRRCREMLRRCRAARTASHRGGRRIGAARWWLSVNVSRVHFDAIPPRRSHATSRAASPSARPAPMRSRRHRGLDRRIDGSYPASWVCRLRDGATPGAGRRER